MAISKITDNSLNITDLSIGDDLTITDDLLLSSDGAIIKFGADADINITHVADTGLTTNGDFTIGDDLILNSDSAVIKFGADADVTITHDPDDGLVLKSTATADDNPFLLTLQTGETDLAANDVIGKIAFQAPDEGTGTDAILVSAAIQARAEGNHSSSSNATSLDFMVGSSEAAATKMTLTSGGHLGISSGGITIDTVGQALGVGTNNPAHAIQVHHTAPEILLEETSSGGSKRISMGVTSGGAPFISAEQSGGSIVYNLAGNEEFKMQTTSFQGRKTGDRFMMGRGPVTGQTLGDDASTTVATLSGCMSQLILIVDGGGGGGVFWCTYQSAVSKLAGSGDYAASDSDGNTSVYKSGNSHSVTLKNRQGSDHTYYVYIMSAYI